MLTCYLTVRRGSLVDDRWYQEAEAGLHRLHRRIGYLAPPGPANEFCHDPVSGAARTGRGRGCHVVRFLGVMY